jgi:bacterioferritin
MKGDPRVIDYLNKGLRSELTAISQYWLHFRLLNHWGLLEIRSPSKR